MTTPHEAPCADRADLLRMLAAQPVYNPNHQASLELVALGARDCCPAILPLLHHESDAIRGIAVRTLQRLGAVEHVDEIATLLQDPAQEIRDDAIDALGRLGATDHAAEIAAQIKNEYGWNSEVLWALARLRATEWGHVILPILSDPTAHSGDRREAVLAIGDLGMKDALAAVESTAQDSDVVVRACAQVTLVRLGALDPGHCLALTTDEIRMAMYTEWHLILALLQRSGFDVEALHRSWIDLPHSPLSIDDLNALCERAGLPIGVRADHCFAEELYLPGLHVRGTDVLRALAAHGEAFCILNGPRIDIVPFDEGRRWWMDRLSRRRSGSAHPG